MGFLAAAGIASAAVSAYGIASSNKARKQGQAQAEAAQKAQAKQLAGQQEALAALFASQPDPAETFREIFESIPGLLEKVLPQLRGQAKATAADFTNFNIGERDRVLSALFGEDFEKFEDRRAAVIDEMDPANLGQEELLQITKKLSPLIPEGTLDPSSGAVQGGVSSPVALYRNLISGEYQERRSQYLGEVRNWLGDAENSAARQQEKAGDYLGTFLGIANGAATNLTGATMQQYQANLASQTGLLNTVLGMGTPTFDSTPYNQAIASNTQNLISGLATAYRGFTYNPGTTAAANYNAPVASLSTGGRSVSDRPASLRYL